MPIIADAIGGNCAIIHPRYTCITCKDIETTAGSSYILGDVGKVGGENGKLINWLVGDADGTGSLAACLFGDASELGTARAVTFLTTQSFQLVCQAYYEFSSESSGEKLEAAGRQKRKSPS